MQKELVIKARDGNLKALNELINNHRELAYSIALKYLKNKNDAEDIVQNSFIIVLKSLKKFRNDAKFSTWLYKIIYYECLRELKGKKQEIDYVPQFIEVKEDYDIDEEINIDNLLKVLKPNEYIAITLFYLKEKSIEDIAKITSLSKSNIKVLLHRARHKMKLSFDNNKRIK